MSEDADRDLSLLYRAGAREEPPSWLDQSILAASRGAERDAAPATGRRPARWQTPLALAAVLTLAVSLGLVMQDELHRVPAVPGSSVPQVIPGTIGEEAALKDRQMQPDPVPDRRAGPQAGAESSDRIESRDAYQKRMPARTQAPETEPNPASGSERRQQSYLLAPQAREERGEARSRVDEPAASSGQEAAAPESLSNSRPPQAPSEQRMEPSVATGIAQSARDRAEESSRAREAAGSRETRTQARPPAPAVRSEKAREPAEPFPGAHVGASPAAPGAVEGAIPSPAQGPGRIASQPSGQPAAQDPSKTPQQWLREIEQLRREGREEQARAQLDQFLKRFPEHPLPPFLR